MFNDLTTRGVADILIAVTDALKGMPEALAAVFPATTLQTSIVHLIRNSLDYASWKNADRWPPRFARSILRRARKRRRPNWMRSQKGHGVGNSRRSVRHGAVRGIA